MIFWRIFSKDNITRIGVGVANWYHDGEKEIGENAASPGERPSPAVPAVRPRLVRGAVRRAVRVGSGFLGLGLAGVQVLAEPGQGLVGDNEAGGDEGLGESDDALAAGVLILGIVNGEEVVAGLGALADGEEDEVLAVGPQLAGGLLQRGQPLVHLAEHLVAERVGLFHVRRHVLVRPRQVGDYGLRQRLVRRVAQLYRLLAVRVLLDGRQAVAHEGVLGDVLSSSGERGPQLLVAVTRSHFHP